MATFTWIPSFDSPESSQPRVLKTALGDGYEQRIRMGLNSDPKTWDLQFNNRTDAERDEIRAFLEAQGGAVAFDWTTPWSQAGRKWVCEEWSIDPTNCNNNQIRAKFRQVFDLSAPFDLVPVDPYFSNVSLLLHMDGSTFVDSGPLGLTLTPAGGPSIITTVNSRSNGTAGDFTSTATKQYLAISGANIAQLANVGTGDFTLELTQYSTNEDTTRALFTVGDYATAGNGFYCWLQGSTPVFTANGVNYTATPSAFANTLNYIAFKRESGVLKIDVNGSSVYSGAMTASFTPSGGSKTTSGAIAAISDMLFHNGSRSLLDEVRFTKGIARPTSSVPTGPFPNA